MAIRVLSITGYKAGSSVKLFYEAFHFKSFETNQYMTVWREHIERENEKAYGFPVKVYVNRRVRPNKEIDMMKVLINTSLVMGQSIDDVLSGSRKRELVEVKKTACQILFDADFEAMEIERQLPFKNRLVYDYRVKMESRFRFEPGYEEKYEAIKKKVLDLTLKDNEA
jgi:urease beta subunit